MTTVQKYTSQLEEIKTNFFLILERYKKNFIAQAATDADEEKNLYAESKAHLTNTYKDLFILESEIDDAIKKQNTKLQTQDKNIKKLGKRYDVDSQKLGVLKDNNLASFPLKRDFERARMHSYIDLVYYIIGIIVLVFLLWLGIKKPSSQQAALLPKLLNNIDNKPIMSESTAKMLTLFLATIMAIVGAKYIK